MIPAKLQPTSSNYLSAYHPSIQVTIFRSYIIRTGTGCHTCLDVLSIPSTRSSPQNNCTQKKVKRHGSSFPLPLPPLYARRSEFHDRSTCWWILTPYRPFTTMCEQWLASSSEYADRKYVDRCLDILSRSYKVFASQMWKLIFFSSKRTLEVNIIFRQNNLWYSFVRELFSEENHPQTYNPWIEL